MHVRTPEKRAAFTELLSGGVTALHMDARVDGLRVPSHLRSRAWLVLNFSYGYQLADFNFDDDGVVASLSFGGRPFPCFVPWEAVFAMSDDSRDTFHLWREDMPPEALDSLSEDAAPAPTTTPARPRPALAATGAVTAPPQEPTTETGEHDPELPTPLKRDRPTFAVIDGGGEAKGGPSGHLERIK